MSRAWCPVLGFRFRLVLVLVLVPALAQYESAGWGELEHSWGRSHQCTAIPEDLRLCYTVGYHQMLLPNLLEHESLAEVRQQAGSWVPLVHKRCHAGTQIFLCSLFAPVCLERPVYPCRRLCRAVRDACSPVMEAFGFPWPDIFNCSRFPQDHLCISTNNTDTPPSQSDDTTCPVCDSQISSEVILEHICASQFAIKAKIKEVRREGVDKRVVLQRRRRLLRAGGLKREELKRLVLYLRNGAECVCQQLDHLDTHFLILGRRVGRIFLLTGVHTWNKTNRLVRRVLKTSNQQCPHHQSVFI